MNESESQSLPAQSYRGSMPALGALLICGVVIAAYWPALRGQFVWDDELLVTKNPLVTGKSNVFSVWFGTDFPLSLVALWMQWLAWGKNPAGYHVVNILLHAAGALLFWRVLLRLKSPGAWLGGLIFAVHPVTAMSVAWISELKNTLSLAFFLLSILWYLRFEDETEVSRLGCRREKEEGAMARSLSPPPGPLPRGEGEAIWGLWYWLSLGAFILALLSKTSTVMLPVVLLLCAWWRRGRTAREEDLANSNARSPHPLPSPQGEGERFTPAECSRERAEGALSQVHRRNWFQRELLQTAPYFAASLAFGLMTIWFQSHQTMNASQSVTEPLLIRVLGVGKAIWCYLGKDLLPVNLSMIYPRWAINPSSPSLYIAWIALGAVLFLLWRFRREWGASLFFGFAYFVITLFPVLGIFPMYFLTLSRVSDHLQYLALLAICALAAAAISTFLKKNALVITSAAIVVVLSILTFHRTEIISNGERLWDDTLAKNPGSWTAQNNLGCLLAEQQKYDDAMRYFESSLKSNPRNAAAYLNSGKLFAMRGDFGEAESRFRTALAIKPRDAETQRSFGMLLANQGKPEQAVPYFQESLQLEPDMTTRLQFAALLRGLGKDREAIAQYRLVLRTKPDSLEALNNLAWLLATSWDDSVRNGAEAVRVAETGCMLTQSKGIVQLGTLAAAYAEAGRFNNAVMAAEQSLELAKATGQERYAEINKELLNYYRAGKPWHEPARK